jgi:hypothetical protein
MLAGRYQMPRNFDGLNPEDIRALLEHTTLDPAAL